MTTPCLRCALHENALVSRTIVILLLLALVLAGSTALAETAMGDTLEWGNMLMGLLGGLALFLFGMEQMGEGLKAAAGEQMKTILAKLTTNRYTAAMTGALVTAVIQSSSVTTVLVVGFISAGLMTMTQSVGVIMGANVGTTITAQIVAFKVTHLALLLIALGFFMLFLARRDRMMHYGSMLMGLGLVFFGMDVMGDAMKPLHSYEPFLELMKAMEQPLWGMLVGAGFTALVQSSSATTSIVIVMASQGFITLEAGIAVALGANIGTCITALLAAIGKPREAIRASVVHVKFNLIGALIWLPFIPDLADWTREFSPASEQLAGMARLAADTPRQVANANTLFNLANTVLFLPFAGIFAWIAVKLVPDKAEAEEKELIRPMYLDREILSTPALALERVRFELGHLGSIVRDMHADLVRHMQSFSDESLHSVEHAKAKSDVLLQSIMEYMADIRQMELSEEDSGHFQELMTIALHMETLGDILANELTNLVRQGRKLEHSEFQSAILACEDLLGLVDESLANAVTSILDEDENAAQAVVASKHDIDEVIDRLSGLQAARIAAETPEGISGLRMEMQIIEILRNIYRLSSRIARQSLPRSVTSES
jgi:phosphate:Na+ symporter